MHYEEKLYTVRLNQILEHLISSLDISYTKQPDAVFSLSTILSLLNKLLIERPVYVKFFNRNKDNITNLLTAVETLILELNLDELDDEYHNSWALGFNKKVSNTDSIKKRYTSDDVLLDRHPVKTQPFRDIRDIKEKANSCSSQNDWYSIEDRVYEILIKIVRNFILDFSAIKELELQEQQLKEADLEELMDDCDECMEDEYAEIDENHNTEDLTIKLIDYEEAYKQIISIASQAISRFNDGKFGRAFGAGNLLKVKFLSLLVELTLHVEYEHQMSEKFNIYNTQTNKETQLVNDSQTSTSNTTNIESPRAKKIKFGGKVERHCSDLDARPEYKCKLPAKSIKRIRDWLVNDSFQVSLQNFFNQLTRCFLSYEQNSILHKEFECLISLVVNPFAPRWLFSRFVESGLLDRLSDSKYFQQIHAHTANICEIATMLYLSEAPHVKPLVEKRNSNKN